MLICLLKQPGRPSAVFGILSVLAFSGCVEPARTEFSPNGQFMVRSRFGSARVFAAKDPDKMLFNGQLQQRQLRKHCNIGRSASSLLAQAITELGLSARAYDRVLRISRTIADLADCDDIRAEHISEAMKYRNIICPDARSLQGQPASL